MTKELFIFDTTNGTDGALCVARRGVPATERKRRDPKTGDLSMEPLPALGLAAYIGAASAVGIESGLHGDNALAELQLNADGVTIDTVAGFTKAEENTVRRTRREIQGPLIEAVGRIVVEIASDPALNTLTLESQSLVSQISKLLRVSPILDGPDLDGEVAKSDEFVRVEGVRDTTRPGRSGRGGRP